VKRIAGIAKATYNFFAGDAIVLAAVAMAFLIAGLLAAVGPRSQLLSGSVFVALILLGITLTLGRERASARRKQQAARRA
jgi:hypothetical protein